MTLQEFVEKWKGKKADFDGRYGAQCVDLYRKYCEEVLGIPQTPPVEGAKDIWKSHGALKEREGAPHPGDVVIYGEKYGKFGHVAIVVSVLADGSFTVLEQDGYAQDGAKLSHRNSEGMLGALYV